MKPFSLVLPVLIFFSAACPSMGQVDNLTPADPKALKDAGVKAPPKPSGSADGAVGLDNSNSVEADPTLVIYKQLKPEQQQRVQKNISEASNFVAGIRLQEGLARLDEVDRIAPGMFMTANLRGAIFTKMRLFDKATEQFNSALKLNPGSFHPKFNLSEIDFVSGNWDKALKQFENLVAASVAEEKRIKEAAAAGKSTAPPKEADAATRKLIEFKAIICRLKLGQVDDVKKRVAAMSYLDDTPSFCMSHAALEYQAGNKEGAQEWIDSAGRIFDQGSLTVYMDSFIESGYIDTLTK